MVGSVNWGHDLGSTGMWLISRHAPKINLGDITGTVASMTEGDPGVESEKAPTTPLVNRDSATRRARRLGVQYDVGELSFVSRSVRSREAVPVPIIFVGKAGAMVGVCTSS